MTQNTQGRMNKELQDLTCLYETTRVLASSMDLRTALNASCKF